MERYPTYIIDVARALRKRQTVAENMLWQRLRDRGLNGLKFKRQHRFYRYIVDFYCDELKLVVELEGSVHDEPEQKEYDAERFEVLAARGLQILRIRNEVVKNNIDAALRMILEFQAQGQFSTHQE